MHFCTIVLNVITWEGVDKTGMWVKAAEALHALMAVYSFALRVFDYCHSGVAHVYSSDPNTPPNISAALHAVFVQVYMLILITDPSGTCEYSDRKRSHRATAHLHCSC